MGHARAGLGRTVTPDLAAFVVRRLLTSFAFVAVVSVGALVLTRMAPGDATSEMQITGASPEAVAQARVRFGLDQPLIVQVGHWLSGVVRLDLGVSSRFEGRAVADLVGERAAMTARLAALALLLATAVGLPLGILTGARPRSWVSRLVTPISIAILACPPLVGALGLLLLAGSTGWLSIAPGHLAVPVIALSLPVAATIERVQAQATADALAAPDLVAAAARGLSPSRILWVHAARQSLRPVLGVYGIIIGGLFSGSLAVEVVTSWPGLGRLMYDALRGRDMYLVAGCALIGAVFLALGNLAADLARAVVDPRVRLRA